MRHTAAEDGIGSSRRTIEQVATKFNIYFLLVMALLSACLFMAGLFGPGGGTVGALDDLPQPLVMITVGVVGFALFFPWFTALYFARHLLHSVKSLEHDNAALHAELKALRERPA